MSAVQRETWSAVVAARVAALSPTQRERLAERVRDEQAAAPRLTAFVVLDQTIDATSSTTDETLRAFVGARLPEYMIPVRFVAVDRLPRTAAGKLDRVAVMSLQGSELRGRSDAPHAAPSAKESEQVPATAAALVAIWKDVLKVDDVGVDDDFFEIGGDSLLSIRVIARAAREGIRIAPERFFERPTIRHLTAAIAPSVNTAVAADEATTIGTDLAAALEVPATGRAPLTPIQHWFLDAVGVQCDWWNQAYVLEVGFALDGTSLGAIAQLLLARHAALRLRLVEQDGVWVQEFPTTALADPCRVVVLDGTDPADYAAEVVAEAAREHSSLRLTDGQLFRMVLFEGANGWRRLLVLAHHLVVDGVSWAIILDDLSTLMTQNAPGAPPDLPVAHERVSARAWAFALADRAATPAVAEAAAHWLTPADDGGAMPVDAAPGGRRSVRDGRDLVTLHADAAMVTIVVDAAATQRLLQDASRRLHAPAQSLLLAALLLAWRSWTSTDVLSLDVEGHGRDVLGPGVDVSRTVGWFTTVFPVRLSLPDTTVAAGTPTAASIVREVQRTLAALPMRGAAHGLARYLAPDGPTKTQLALRARSTMLFNYLGTHDLGLPETSRLRVTGDASGDARSPHVARPYLMELNARVEDGRLMINVEYARTVHLDTTIQRFASLFREALDQVADAVAELDVAGLDRSGMQAVADLLDALDEADDDSVDQANDVRASGAI